MNFPTKIKEFLLKKEKERKRLDPVVRDRKIESMEGVRCTHPPLNMVEEGQVKLF